eukprot:1821733-Rhodomonas_salina.2
MSAQLCSRYSTSLGVSYAGGGTHSPYSLYHDDFLVLTKPVRFCTRPDSSVRARASRGIMFVVRNAFFSTLSAVLRPDNVHPP